MADHSKIEWTEATKRCSNCRGVKAVDNFSKDRTRIDGLTYWCKACRNSRGRAQYQPKPRPAPGRRFVAPRDGDLEQARRRVNYLIQIGQLAPPNQVPCVDCGHTWCEGERRHEYDHHRGYAARHHEDVEAVCSTCHHAREAVRRAAA